MSENPLDTFQKLYEDEKNASTLDIPGACCLSTVGLDGHPNARFVALKDVTEDGFVVAGPMYSRKGKEMEHDARVALTFWWVEIGVQVRVQGTVELLPKDRVAHYFALRSRESQITSWASTQGEVLTSQEEVLKRVQEREKEFADKDVPKPDGWNGYTVVPQRIEYLQLKTDRMHTRTLFTKDADLWTKTHLQP